MNLFETIDKLPAMIDEYVDREIKEDRIALIKFVCNKLINKTVTQDDEPWYYQDLYAEQLLKEFEDEK